MTIHIRSSPLREMRAAAAASGLGPWDYGGRVILLELNVLHTLRHQLLL